MHSSITKMTHIRRLFKITSRLELRVIIIPKKCFNHFDYVIKYMLPLFNWRGSRTCQGRN